MAIFKVAPHGRHWQEDVTMSDEQAQILEMLVAGRVTVEQAALLLEAVDPAANPGSHGSVSSRGALRQWDERRVDFFAGLTVEQMRQLHDHGVSRSFIQEIYAALRHDLSVADLIALYESGVTPHFVTELTESGCANLTVREAIRLYEHGVDGNFVRDLRSVGLADATPAQYVELYDHGVDADFIREMQGLGLTDLSVGHLITLRDNGVDEGACE
jgi:hypothetical protein